MAITKNTAGADSWQTLRSSPVVFSRYRSILILSFFSQQNWAAILPQFSRNRFDELIMAANKSSEFDSHRVIFNRVLCRDQGSHKKTISHSLTTPSA